LKRTDLGEADDSALGRLAGGATFERRPRRRRSSAACAALTFEATAAYCSGWAMRASTPSAAATRRRKWRLSAWLSSKEVSAAAMLFVSLRVIEFGSAGMR
jgi:hypothetical protein